MPEVQVTCATGSGVASFACTATGDLFSWGSSKRGQLGLGSHVLATNEPLRVAALKNIVQVCSGWGHALASDGDCTNPTSIAILFRSQNLHVLMCSQS